MSQTPEAWGAATEAASSAVSAVKTVLRIGVGLGEPATDKLMEQGYKLTTARTMASAWARYCDWRGTPVEKGSGASPVAPFALPEMPGLLAVAHLCGWSGKNTAILLSSDPAWRDLRIEGDAVRLTTRKQTIKVENLAAYLGDWTRVQGHPPGPLSPIFLHSAEESLHAALTTARMRGRFATTDDPALIATLRGLFCEIQAEAAPARPEDRARREAEWAATVQRFGEGKLTPEEYDRQLGENL
jgi:hypothetical protein